MIYRRLTSTNDYSLGASKQNFISEREAVGQAVTTRLKLLYAEWWEDLENGLPLFQQILGLPAKSSNKQIVDKIVQDRIQDTLDVTGVIQFTSTFDTATRQYTFNCTIDTTYGQLTLQEVTL